MNRRKFLAGLACGVSAAALMAFPSGRSDAALLADLMLADIKASINRALEQAGRHYVIAAEMRMREQAAAEGVRFA